jgi:hypothetical protein
MNVEDENGSYGMRLFCLQIDEGVLKIDVLHLANSCYILQPMYYDKYFVNCCLDEHA